jgi:hypothetical protein
VQFAHWQQVAGRAASIQSEHTDGDGSMTDTSLGIVTCLHLVGSVPRWRRHMWRQLVLAGRLTGWA